MPNSKVLQVPEILEIQGSTLRIKHPDISGYTRNYLISAIAAGGTTATVSDNNGFARYDWFILGETGDSKTEECDVSSAVARGTSITITDTTKFAHELNAPITRILERAIKIYGAATDGGTGTLIASIDTITTPIADAFNIQWDKPYTEYTLISTDTAYNYYYCKFTDGTTDSVASDYVASSGLVYNSVSEIVSGALNEVNAEIDGKMITREWLLRVMNDWQEEVTHFVTQDGISKDWSWEIFEDTSSLVIVANTHKYALSGLSEDLKYDDNERGLINVRFGSRPLKYIDITSYDQYMEGRVSDSLESGCVAGETTITLVDSSEFGESGSVYLGSETLTYTANAQSTGILSGIPASGTGSIAESHSAGDPVWQGASPSLPTKYTIFDGYILLDVPPDATYAYYKLKVRGLKKLSRLTSFSSVTDIPFTYLAKYFVASKIEAKKGNTNSADRLYTIYLNKLEIEALKDPLQTTEQTTYYDFDYSGSTLMKNTDKD
jgi:hypothetical protein